MLYIKTGRMEENYTLAKWLNDELEGEELKRVTTIIETALANRPALPDYLNLKHKKDAAWA